MSGSPSLRRRLLQRLLAPLLLLFVLGGWGGYALALHYANSVYDGWLYDSANSLALLVERTDRGVILDLPQAAERLFDWDVADTTYYRVAGSRSGLIAGRSRFPDITAAPSRYQRALLGDGIIDGHQVRVATLELPAADLGEDVSVQVAETTNKRNTLARQILLGALLPQIVLIGAAALTLWFGIRGGLAPLGELAGHLQRQDHLRRQPLAGDDVPAEVRPLTRALDDLLRRLDAALAAQQRFVADAAHQLRTPLTALKLNIEQALQEARMEDVLPALQESARAVARMTRLVNQLLLLARTDPEAAAATPFEPFDLAALTSECGAGWVPRALRKQVEIELTVPPAPVVLRGSRVLLAEMLDNLLDNAVKYHPGGGRIALSLDASGRIRVADDGPGIPPARRDEALQRFRRVDRSGSDGSGLGLAIVQEIVKLHGGAVRLAEGLEGRGLGVQVDLPAEPAQQTQGT
ncbi:MAG: sensor histidine kinase N-terminal domain-containing protein [Nevskia sp.]|nr:sensor histidine kinase N-terminal domain-containing protein [Nevskia sp.]